MIEAILWDNDGLLLDTESVFFDLTRERFSDCGIELTEAFWSAEYLGNALSSRQIAARLGMDPALVSPLLERRNCDYLERISRNVAVRPDVRETFEALSGTFRFAMVTGSARSQIHIMHSQTGLLDYFEVIVTDDDVEKPKPHPEPYLKALERLGVAPGAALAVEDSLRGFQSAVAAGIACLVVPNRLTRVQRFEGALGVEESVSGLLKHLQGAPRPVESVTTRNTINAIL